MKNNCLIRILLFVGLLSAIAIAILFRNQFDGAALEAWVRDAGLIAPLLFISIYAIATVLFLPGCVIALAGGALFGPVLGVFYSLTGATFGATMAFLLARYLAADWVLEKSGSRVERLVDGVESEGWRFVAFVRLMPLFPFTLVNYVFGLTRLRLLHYIVATYLFMLPATIAYTYLGYVGQEAISGSEHLIQKGLLAIALIATLAFLPRLIGILRLRSIL